MKRLLRRIVAWASKSRQQLHPPSSTKKVFGVIPSPVDDRDYVYVPTSGSAQIPRAKYLPQPLVRNQGIAQSCVAHAICSALEIKHELDSLAYNDLLLSPHFLYYYGRHEHFCTAPQAKLPADVGTVPRDVLKVAAKHGVAPLAAAPYSDHHTAINQEPSAVARGFAPLFKINTYWSLWRSFDMKEALAANLPVVVGMIFTEQDTNIKGGELVGNGRQRYRHMVLITGYNDDIHNSDGTSGAFILQNSWGTRWGNNGTAWVPYNLMDKQMYEAWAIQ